ncbi:MAG: hypothetical protein Q7V88_07100 [Actinomycetota bacterium]|nr:hypothetical protein [Actinomycetota bacterium]
MTNQTEHEEFKDPVPDREPTPEEEAAAERARRGVDEEGVAAEYEHMTELGADVRGEGQVEPEPS